MKCLLTRLFSTHLFVMLTGLLLASNPSPGKDFLITLNGSKLTGNIKIISFSSNESSISFENDFGDIYTVHPATVSGFAHAEKGKTSLYESKLLDGRWMFLKVEKRGEALSLYMSSERQLKFTSSSESPIIEKEKSTQIWLQFADEQPFKIYRLNFKSVLRRKMANYPVLVERLGKRGFKYNNLPAIVDLYNQLDKQKGKRS
ncbi:MAG: hypothetical protein AAFZ15_28385 [Bacteroidota bacterium]